MDQFAHLDWLVVQETTKQLSTLRWLRLMTVGRQFSVQSKDRRSDVAMTVDYDRSRNEYLVIMQEQQKKKGAVGEGNETDEKLSAISVQNNEFAQLALFDVFQAVFLHIGKLKSLTFGASCRQLGVESLVNTLLQRHQTDKIAISRLYWLSTKPYKRADFWRLISYSAAHLRTLRIRYANSSSSADGWLVRAERQMALESCTSLRSLILTNCDRALVQEFLNVISKLDTLTSLTLRGDGPENNNQSKRLLINALSQNDKMKLKRLSVNVPWLPSISVPEARPLLGQLAVLVVELARNSLSGFAWEAFRPKLAPVLAALDDDGVLIAAITFERTFGRFSIDTLFNCGRNSALVKFFDFWLRLADQATKTIKLRLLPLTTQQEVMQLVQAAAVMDRLKEKCAGLAVEHSKDGKKLLFRYGSGQLVLCP